MESSKLIMFIQVKDKGVNTLMDYYINKGKYSGVLQAYIDSVANNLAKSFIEQYQEDLKNKLVQEDIFRYLSSIGADEEYSGYRFSEALYKQLSIYVRKSNEINLLR